MGLLAAHLPSKHMLVDPPDAQSGGRLFFKIIKNLEEKKKKNIFPLPLTTTTRYSSLLLSSRLGPILFLLSTPSNSPFLFSQTDHQSRQDFSVYNNDNNNNNKTGTATFFPEDVTYTKFNFGHLPR